MKNTFPSPFKALDMNSTLEGLFLPGSLYSYTFKLQSSQSLYPFNTYLISF